MVLMAGMARGVGGNLVALQQGLNVPNSNMDGFLKILSIKLEKHMFIF